MEGHNPFFIMLIREVILNPIRPGDLDPGKFLQIWCMHRKINPTSQNKKEINWK